MGCQSLEKQLTDQGWQLLHQTQVRQGFDTLPEEALQQRLIPLEKMHTTLGQDQGCARGCAAQLMHQSSYAVVVGWVECRRRKFANAKDGVRELQDAEALHRAVLHHGRVQSFARGGRRLNPPTQQVHLTSVGANGG